MIVKPFPEINDVFRIGDDRERFVFLPLLTVDFQDNAILKNKQFHFVSVWDTGTYEKEYFNDHRPDTHIIKFKIVGDRYVYGGSMNFPFVDSLGDAYETVVSNFKDQIHYYLRTKSNDEFKYKSKTLVKGGDLVHEKVKGVPRWEAGYYFERITKYKYVEAKYLEFGKVCPDFGYSSVFIKSKEDEERIISDFNSFGKDKNELVNQLLGKPHWLQANETPNVDGKEVLFIGSINEYDFTNGTAEIFLFYDEQSDYVYQVFQWT